MGMIDGNNGGVMSKQGPKPNLAQMSVPNETKATLQKQGYPSDFKNMAELHQFLGKLQQDNPEKYQGLFDAMHPGLSQQGLPDLGDQKSVIRNIGR